MASSAITTLVSAWAKLEYARCLIIHGDPTQKSGNEKIHNRMASIQISDISIMFNPAFCPITSATPLEAQLRA